MNVQRGDVVLVDFPFGAGHSYAKQGDGAAQAWKPTRSADASDQ